VEGRAGPPVGGDLPRPEGEPLRETQARAGRGRPRLERRLGPDATWLACSHGDVIKAVVADAMGLHLDQFQRIVVDPCSVTVIRYTELRPFVVRVNDTGGGVADLVPPKRKGRRRKASSDARWAAARAPASV
jgi:broad specificity phosphatase PhoE